MLKNKITLIYNYDYLFIKLFLYLMKQKEFLRNLSKLKERFEIPQIVIKNYL